MIHKVVRILEEIHPEHDFLASKDFITDGLLDSFDIVNLVSELETTFDIVIAGEDVTPENFMNIDCLGSFVKRYLADNES